MASGVPHQLTADDNYLGYFLPSGSTVLFNAWFAFLCLRTDQRLIDSQGNHPERGTLSRPGEVQSGTVPGKDGFRGRSPGRRHLWIR